MHTSHRSRRYSAAGAVLAMAALAPVKADLNPAALAYKLPNQIQFVDPFGAEKESRRTPVLGAEVYASQEQERIVYHACKSRACPSCGHRATIQWQRERWAALPDVRYKGITFTMHKDFWTLFQNNRPLANAKSCNE